VASQDLQVIQNLQFVQVFAGFSRFYRFYRGEELQSSTREQYQAVLNPSQHRNREIKKKAIQSSIK